MVAGVFSTIAPPGTRLTLCSPSNPDGWRSWLAARESGCGCDYGQADSLGEVLDDETVDFVAVVRSARTNAATALAGLKAGKPVLVEKPFALTREEAQPILAAAATGFCATGLVFLFASNLRRFASAASTLGTLSEIQIVWHDPMAERRHGEDKSYDTGLSCVQDVFPHIWSLLRLIEPDAPLIAGDTQVSGGGRTIGLDLTMGDTLVRVEIARDAGKRQRHIKALGENGIAEIDFAHEPGRANLNGRVIDIAEGFSSPLGRELDCIARGLTGPFATPLCLVENAVEAIELTDAFMPAIRQQQADQMEAGLQPDAPAPQREAADYALREIAGGLLAGIDVTDGWRAVGHWLAGDALATPLPEAITADLILSDLQNRIQSPKRG